MSDYKNLRTTVEAANRVGLVNVSLDALQVAALLVDYDVARSQAKPKKSEHPPEFVEAYKAMERAGIKWRPGSTPAAAFKAWQARVKAGASPIEILAGADKYARYCKATGCEIKQAQVFFGPGEYFSADWTMPKASGRKGQLHGSIGEQDFNAGIRADGSF